MAGYIGTSKRTDWCSPDRVVDVVRNAFGGTIDLDPCSNPKSIVGARLAWELPRDDGLAQVWGDGRIYANPPWGRIHVHRETREVVEASAWKEVPEAERAAYETTDIGDWIAKAREEHEEHGAQVCLLLPAAIDTRPWHRDIWSTASAVGFFKGRLKFRGADACAPMACALAYFGHRPQRFERAFALAGKVVRP
jgi:hypothetical protein